MVKNAKPKGKKAPLTDLQRQTAALNRHALAMNKHTAALTEAIDVHAKMAVALKNNIAVIAAAKVQKTFNQKTADAGACLSQWLMQAKGVSSSDSNNPVKTIAGDMHIGAPQEMQLCLEAVQTCMARKGNFYHLDTTSPNANQHLISLLNSNIGGVVADIVLNTT